MTLDEIRERVETIRATAATDPARAHILEDTLMRDVLLAITAGTPYCRRLAAEALHAADIRYARHPA